MRRRLAVAVAVLVTLAGVAGPAFAAAPGPAQAPEWWFDTWHVPSLWNSGATGRGVTIAEIDTGVNAGWPGLAANVLPGKNFGSAGGDGRTDHATALFGHGTAMASIMIARPDFMGITGLAPDAKVLPVAVPLNGTDDEPANGDDHLADAITWAVNNGGKIITMSLGGRSNQASSQSPCPKDEQDAITYAIKHGAIVLASSGNDGQKGNPVEEPGVCLGVVSVGAVDRRGVVPPFSSRHKYLTVSAPGVNVPSLGRDRGNAYVGDGTSQATAITAASLALIWSQYPALTGRQVVARMLATLDHPAGHPAGTQDPSYGYGIVNTYRAITANVPANAPNPVYSALEPFLSTQSANVRALPAPRPASRLHIPPGHFAIGQAPSVWTNRVWTAFAVGLLGAFALIVLAVVGTTRSRRHAALAVNGKRTWRGQARDVPPAPTHQDELGVVWHDLTAPRDEPPRG